MHRTAAISLDQNDRFGDSALAADFLTQDGEAGVRRYFYLGECAEEDNTFARWQEMMLV